MAQYTIIAPILLMIHLFSCINAEDLIIPNNASEIILPIASTPRISGDILYIGLPSGNVYAIDKTSGAELWMFRNPRSYSFFSSPVPYEEIVLVVDENGRIYALDADSGEIEWHLDIGQAQTKYTDRVDSVVLCGNDNSLYAVDIIAREVLWRFDSLDGMDIALSRSVLNNGEILLSAWAVVLNKSYVIVIDSRTGSALQAAYIDSDTRLTAPHVTENGIWLGSTSKWLSSSSRDSGNVFRYDRSTGKLEFKSDESGAVPEYSLLASYEDALFFASWGGLSQHEEGHFYHVVQVNALDMATGEIRWKRKIGEYSFAVIGALDGDVLAGGADDNIYVLDGDSGNILWQFPVRGRIRSDFACDDHTAYFRTDFSLYAIDLSQKSILWEKALH